MTAAKNTISLSARGLRIATRGSSTTDKISFSVTGERLLLAGPGAEALEQVVTGRGVTTAGEFDFDGQPWEKAVKEGTLTFAPLSPPLVPHQTVSSYLSLSFSIRGLTRTAASGHALNVLSWLGIPQLANVRTDDLADWQQRLVGLALALTPASKTLWVERPLTGLTSEQTTVVLTSLAGAARRRPIIVTNDRIDASASCWPLVQGATDLLWIGVAGETWLGNVSDVMGPDPTVWMELHGDQQRARAELEKVGVHINGQGSRFVAVLSPGMSAAEVLKVARQAGGIIVELLPLSAGQQVHNSPAQASSSKPDAGGSTSPEQGDI